jgi:hypothetical protein
MLFNLIIFQEQGDGQIPSLATIARQTLDQTRHNRRHTFRFNAQSCRSSCRKCVVTPATDDSKTTSQADSANQG